MLLLLTMECDSCLTLLSYIRLPYYMQAATRESILLEGYLKKKSPKAILGLRPWQERYFVLWGHQLCYYKKKDDVGDESKVLGYLLVENMVGAEAPSEKGADRFDVVLAGVERRFELQAESASVCSTWVNTISNVLKEYGKKPKALAPPTGGAGSGEKYWKAAVHKKLMQRRAAIYAEAPPASEAEVANRVYDKSPEVAELLFASVRRSMAFGFLSEAECREVVKAMWVTNFSKKQQVIGEGEPARNFYIVAKGSFDYSSTQEHKEATEASTPQSRASFTSSTSNVLQKGDYFGENVLLHEVQSSHTVVAREDAQCYTYDRAAYKNLVTSNSKNQFAQRVQFLRGSQIFGQLPDDLVKRMAEALEERHYKARETIIRQDELGDSFYILLQGSALATRDGTEVHRYDRPGEYFGERALLKNEPRSATIIALTAVTVLFLTRKDFTDLMGKVEETFERGVRKYSVLNREIIDNGARSPTAASSSSGASSSASSSSADAPASPSAATATAAPGTKSFGGIKMHFTQSETPEDAAAAEEQKAGRSGAVTRERKCPVKSLADLKVIGTLGRGTFGHVQLVSDENQNTYALKAVNKNHVVRHNQIPHILNERAVMLELDHPFVVRLHGTMRDQNFLYFLLEPSLGGELFSVLRTKELFDSDTARFYAAIVVSVFQYMHSLDILYRDLKPENLLMDGDGYLRVTDFGFAKKTKDRTYTFCGTPDYLAPEIVASAGHHTGADWWTLGNLIFEMLAGYTPFYDEAGPTSMYSKILAGKVSFPPHFTPAEQDLVASLLQTKPTRRLGVMLGGAELIKKHPWFEKMDWNALLQKKLQPPIPVYIKSKFDMSNFDSYPEEENINEEYVVDPANPTWDHVF